MSTINNTTLASYFQLNNNSNSATQSQNSASGLADALAAISNVGSQTSTDKGGSSYLLDLSDEAKAYLEKTKATASANSTSAMNTGEVSLSRKQQEILNDILLKYKDAPYDDDTFLKIQQDMEAAGLDADTLAARSQVRQLNPTVMFLNALNGIESNAGTMGDVSATATDFLKSVAEQWKNISTLAGKTDKA